MVDLAIAKFHSENITHMTKIEQRIIGIDGNGTGRQGALQRLEAKVDNGFRQIESSVSTLRKHTYDEENIPKKRIRQIIYGIVASVGVAAMSFVGAWGVVMLEHAKGWK